MTEKSGENWQVEHPNIDHVVVHSIAGTPHGNFAMGDGVIGPSNANSIESRKRMYEDSNASGSSGTETMLRRMESNPGWRSGIERVLQAITEKVDLDFNELMHPHLESSTDWCQGVERVLEAIAEIVPIDISALLQSRQSDQSTSTSKIGASWATSQAAEGGRSDARTDNRVDDDQISA
ncbi:hypothetical protein EJB05_56456 [Eragrostis curvula]|uniref:Uncharacterized protein n=1 Tax=Eragrostis curvula TaxID=38414 RepID=A0A5J9SG75_9POAL|nr:hypothetical protein EJB05_56456 [Eragrostis curvula]